MTLTKNQFFLILGTILLLVCTGPRLWWLAGSRAAIGEMRFIGHGDLGSALGISSYPVISFTLGGDTIYFNGNVNLDAKRGDQMAIRYQKSNPSDAQVDSFSCMWMSTVSYALLPTLILFVLYLTPDRFDPLIPKGHVIVLGKRPFICIRKT
jgi:hypothetical protein